MNCSNCNTEIPEGSVFCQKCGNKVDKTRPINSGNGYLLEKPKKYSTLKKVLIVCASAIALFIIYAILSPDVEDPKSKTITVAKTTDSPAATKAAAKATDSPATSAATAAPQKQVIPEPTVAKQPAQQNTPAPKNGFHKITDSNGAIYEGNFLNDMKNGKGTLTQKDGIKVVGDFFENKITGQESVFYTNGERYEGAMVNGLREGKGKYYYANGDIYDGLWSNHKKSGYGVTKFINGDIYEGQYVDGLQKDSNCKMTYKNGVIYIGEINNGILTGQGTCYYSDGIYRGSFVNGKRDGYGRFDWESQSYYEGFWKDGKRNGQGTSYNSNTGVKDFGTWKDDVLVTHG